MSCLPSVGLGVCLGVPSELLSHLMLVSRVCLVPCRPYRPKPGLSPQHNSPHKGSDSEFGWLPCLCEGWRLPSRLSPSLPTLSSPRMMTMQKRA